MTRTTIITLLLCGAMLPAMRFARGQQNQPRAEVGYHAAADAVRSRRFC